MVREARNDELGQLLELYLHLHEKSVPEDSDLLRGTWQRIMNDDLHHIVVWEQDGKIVSSCVCVIVPNLTHGVRPYALVENVVTDEAFRGRGYATACLDYAAELAKAKNCYKIMLMTGSKLRSTLDFYAKAGYNGGDKTAFIRWLDPCETV